MKYLYHNNNLRALVEQKSDWGTKYLKLSVQKKRAWWLFSWWVMVKWVDVEIDNYWVVPGHERDGCMTLHYQFGGMREIWPPDIFDLKARMQQLVNDYLKEAEQIAQKENATLKHLSTL